MDIVLTILKDAIPIIAVIVAAFFGYKRYLSERTVEREEKTTLFLDSIRGKIKGIREQVKLLTLTVNSALSSEVNVFRDDLSNEIGDLLNLIERPFFDTKVHDIGLLYFGLSRHVLQLYADLNALKLQSTRLRYATEDNFRIELIHFSYDVKRWVAEATDLNCLIELWVAEGDYPPWKIMRERGDFYRKSCDVPPVDFDVANKKYLTNLRKNHRQAYKAIKKLYNEFTDEISD